MIVGLVSVAAGIMVMSLNKRESFADAKRNIGAVWHSLWGYKGTFEDKPVGSSVCLKGVSLGLLFAYISSLPFILQTHYGLSQTNYGLVIGFNAIFMVVGTMVALKFKLLKNAAVAGAFILVFGACGEAFALYRIHSIWVYELFMIIVLFALGLIFNLLIRLP